MTAASTTGPDNVRFGGPFGPAIPALQVQAGVLGSDQAISATTDTLILTTASLAVGTWAIDMQAELTVTGATASDAMIYAATGSATAAFTGPIAADGELPAIAGGSLGLSLACIATVTVAGTLQLRAYATQAGTAKQYGTVTGSRAVTGYRALRIA